MRTPVTLVMLGLAALLLTACDKNPSGPPPPTVITTNTGAAPSVPTDTSLPSAAEVASAASNGVPAPVREAGRTTGTRTTSRESMSMPMAGQNNDHSAPLSSAGPASAPR